MDILESMINHPKFATRESEYIRWYPKSLTPFVTQRFPSTLRPTGIYIHVPFCDKLCRFCPFNKQASAQAELEAFVTALMKEIELYEQICESPGLDFIYFGGGTPSVLPPSVIERIIGTIGRYFPIKEGVEVTAECHPTHLNRTSARALRNAGISRISSGIQSLDDDHLRRLGAQHTVADGRRAIESVGEVFGSIAVDLLFRCPGQTVEHWMEQLTGICAYDVVDHLSLYSLIQKSSANQPNPILEAKMTVLAHEYVKNFGFTHYASCASGGFDLAKPGRKCVYEERHWGAPQAEFVGLGPGALGYAAGCTTVNGLGFDNYVESLSNGRLAVVSSTSTTTDEAMRRYFVLGVKTLEVPLDSFRAQFGVDPQVYFSKEFAEVESAGFAQISNDTLALTDVGRLFVDSVSTYFFSPAEFDVPHPEEPQIRRVEVALHKEKR